MNKRRKEGKQRRKKAEKTGNERKIKRTKGRENINL